MAGSSGEMREWVTYLCLGTLLPAAVLFLSWIRALGAVGAAAFRVAEVLLSAVFVWSVVVFVLTFASASALVCASLSGVACLVAARMRAGGVSVPRTPAEVWRALLAALVLWVSWTAAVKLVHWQPLGVMATETAYASVVLLLAVVTVPFAIFASPDVSRRASLVSKLGDVLAASTIVPFAFSLASLFAFWPAFEHWAWAAGPAQLVREGGWLLWDVHATYGFLSTLVLVALPVGSTWQSLYLVNSVLLAVSAFLLYRLLRASLAGLAGFVIALAVAVSAVVLLPGHTKVLTGAQVFPSVGAFRFLWCWVLVGVLAAHFARRARASRFSAIARSGSLAWALGVLWSAESAAYVTAIWLPAYAVILWDRFGTLEDERRVSPGDAASGSIRWMMLPFALLAGALAFISAYYVAFLGELPDFRVFFFSALAFTGEFNRHAIEPAGPVWILLVVLVTVATVVAQLLRGGSRQLPALALVTGCFGLVWATASYFVAHSVSEQVPNLAALLCLASGALLFVVRSGAVSAALRTSVRLALVPLLTMVVFATFGNGAQMASYLRRTALRFEQQGPTVPLIDRNIPIVDDELRALLLRAGVEPGHRLTSLHRDVPARIPFPLAGVHPTLRSEHPALVPVKPSLALASISGDRERVERLFSRWIGRLEPSGWLLVPNEEGRVPWVADLLEQTHEPGPAFSSPRWTLTWMQLKEAPQP